MLLLLLLQGLLDVLLERLSGDNNDAASRGLQLLLLLLLLRGSPLASFLPPAATLSRRRMQRRLAVDVQHVDAQPVAVAVRLRHRPTVDDVIVVAAVVVVGTGVASDGRDSRGWWQGNRSRSR